MADSRLFISPAFIFTETSILIVASIAAYELVFGDFIWKKQQQQEARQHDASMQSHRDRGRLTPGYNSFESRQLQHGGQHRSLSPRGGRGDGRGGGQSRGGALPSSSSRRASNEETSLLYPSRASRGGIISSNNHRDGRMSSEEQGYYSSSSGDNARYASPGRGSSGDSTRRLFYKVILLALLSRFILLPVETYCLSPPTINNSLFELVNHPTLLQILLRISQTLPDILFASALGLLVIFCAKIAFAAMPPLSPELSTESIQGDTVTTTAAAGERQGLLGGEEGDTAMSNDTEGNKDNMISNRLKKARTSLCIASARLSRTILASKKTFATCNIILSTSYTLLVMATTALLATNNNMFMWCEVALWIYMATIYACLLLSLVYVAILLGRALHPGIVRRKTTIPSSDSQLALRLVWTCILLAIMFIDRVTCFSMVAHHALLANYDTTSSSDDDDDDYDDDDYEESIRIVSSSYRTSTIEYAIFESLPVLFLLFMMHRKRKEVNTNNDVLIIHSIMSNLFRSTGRLMSSESSDTGPGIITSAASGGDGGSTRTSGGLGFRRFQTYGGARGDSFPPSSSSSGGMGNNNKPRRNNFPRATSSSGGGAAGGRTTNDALALENATTPIAGSSSKMGGGLKPYMPVR